MVMESKLTNIKSTLPAHYRSLEEHRKLVSKTVPVCLRYRGGAQRQQFRKIVKTSGRYLQLAVIVYSIKLLTVRSTVTLSFTVALTS